MAGGDLRVCRRADYHPPGRRVVHTGGVAAPVFGAVLLFLPTAHTHLEQIRHPDHQQLLRWPVQYLGDERAGAVLLAAPYGVARCVDAGAGQLRDDGALDVDPGLPLRGAGLAGAVRLLPDRVCGVVGLAGVQPYPRLDHGGRHRGDLHEWVGRCLAAAASVSQTSTVGILRGAMKYIQVSAMKYIAGIRVNSTV